MKNTKNKTVYFDDYNIKAFYKKSLVNKILAKINFRAFETETKYIIEMSIDNLTSKDLKIQLKSKQVIVSSRYGHPKLNMRRVFNIPNHIHAMGLESEIKNKMLFIRIPKINLNHSAN